MTEHSSNKRNHTRVSIHSRFIFCLAGKEYIGQVNNISPGGLYLDKLQPTISSPNYMGQRGELFFSDHAEETGIECEIMHIDDNGIGVSFSFS